jgi:hypothetical protein
VASSFNLERGKITALDRIERLLVAVHVAVWWACGLGLRVVRQGQRHRCDRRHRRELSLLRLGRTACLAILDHDRRPPLPFPLTPTGWILRWLQ